ncbi:hypothetical protein M9H77_21203 [Catharanthus roseus]|uniref:Uncharacterized protein n=1 Tax=Catharanthus roseus TaxID=4058 RepID=A0ACC0ANQ4_CATRO|nr:hypothetical protein M9H77_21203 [Catharanthus roseus]
MHRRILKDDLQRSKRSCKITRLYEAEVIKLKTLKTRRMVRDSFIRCFKCNSTDHLVAGCLKAIEKEKGALEAKVEAIKKKTKDDDPNFILIEMYDVLKKISKRNTDLKNKIDDLLYENSKLVCENKTLLAPPKELFSYVAFDTNVPGSRGLILTETRTLDSLPKTTYATDED